MKRFALFFAALLWAPLTTVSGHAKDYEDVSVKVETVTAGSSITGYAEFRAIIINRSTAKSHRVTIEFSSMPYGAVRRTAEVAPSSAITIHLIAPGLSQAGLASVLIDGARQKEDVEVDFSRTNAWVSRSFNMSFLLVSPNVDKNGLMNEAAVVAGFKNRAGHDDVAYLAYKSPMPEWSANWVAYSSFDGVVITAEELREAPDAVRSALWRFTGCGGSLLVIGAMEIPEQWRSRRVNSVEVETEEAEESEETIETGGTAPKKVSMNLSDATQTYYVGFGNVTIIDAATVKRILPAQWSAIKLSWNGSRPIEKPYRDIVDINKDFPVIERIGIPVRGLFVLMLIFVIVIGPINLIWLARRRAKIWMLWTVPAIALLTCLAVTGFAFLGEGLSATSRVETFTILDESSHRASTIGWTAFYAPITPSEGLHFSYDTELTQVRPDVWYYYRRGDNRTIDLSNDQHLDSRWITARVPVYFKLRKSETRRERLTIRQDGGGAISVVNGLGSDVRELWLADRNGQVYSASGIRAGAEAKLSSANLKLAGNNARLRELFTSSDWPGKIKEAALNPQNFLAPGCYLATLDASPFAEEGLEKVKTRKGRALVYGVSAPIAEGER
jgi:hypothetical protein